MARSTSEMKIQEYQDHTFAINDNTDRRLTDEKLLADWVARFGTRPAKVFGGDDAERLRQIRSIRGLYNKRHRNEHGQRDDQGQVVGRPERVSLPYHADGTRFAYSRAWLQASLAGRSLEDAGVPAEVATAVGLALENSSSGDRRWTDQEVRSTIAAYFAMLSAEQRGQSYSKAASRRALGQQLDERSDTAIERKHQNISAVLAELGLPYIEGYKPLGNYQQLLAEQVGAFLAAQPVLLDELLKDSSTELPVPTKGITIERATSSYVEDPPLGRKMPDRSPHRTLTMIDWTVQQKERRELGDSGESWVVEFERARLREANRGDLAELVEWVSKKRGDGAGYDVRSFEANGTERLIEVKTTRGGKERAFYVTANEVLCSVENESRYHLYRLFGYPTSPSIFILSGALVRNCDLEPVSYAARVKSDI